MYVGSFKWVVNTSDFSKDFREMCNEYSDQGKILEAEGQYPEKYMIFTMIHP